MAEAVRTVVARWCGKGWRGRSAVEVLMEAKTCARDPRAVLSTGCSIRGVRIEPVEHRLLRPATAGRGEMATVTPEQIALVEQTMATVDLDELAADFYRRAFAERSRRCRPCSPPIPRVQRARFAAELDEIVRSIRSIDDFVTRARQLGSPPPRVRRAARPLPGHGRGAARRAGRRLGEALDGRAREEAWTLAYNLTAETMMMGAMEGPARADARAVRPARRPAGVGSETPSFEYTLCRWLLTVRTDRKSRSAISWLDWPCGGEGGDVTLASP